MDTGRGCKLEGGSEKEYSVGNVVINGCYDSLEGKSYMTSYENP